MTIIILIIAIIFSRCLYVNNDNKCMVIAVIINYEKLFLLIVVDVLE